MQPKLKSAYQSELSKARNAYGKNNLAGSFEHLERAHILGQRNFGPHLTTHCWMLKIGLRRRDGREIFGQILRMLAVFPGHLFGRLPIGNTGGANVSALKSMPIPPDLLVHFEGDV